MSGRAQRFPAKYPVIFRKGPEMYPSTICNISIGGGCILGEHQLEKGHTILLDYGVGQTRAVVMWTMEKMVGLKFEDILSDFAMLNIRNIKAVA
ncbi:MAG: PilZ domain-containing protein [Octadecabacter sp.]